MPRYRVGRIADSGLPGDGPGITGLRLAAQRLGVSHVGLGQGDAFRMGAARVDVLWPPRDVVAGTAADTAPSSNREVNDTSVVLALSIGTQRALLTGDLETDRDGQPWRRSARPDSPGTC